MSKENNDKKSSKDSKNLFEIMDSIIDQLNKTKRLFIIMILTVMIIPPMVFVIIFELLGPLGSSSSTSSLNSTSTSTSSSYKIGMMVHHKSEHREGLLGFNPLFTIVKNIPLIIGIVWLGIGIRQWILLSKWSRKYQRYKELQKKIDKKIDNDNDLNVGDVSYVDK